MKSSTSSPGTIAITMAGMGSRFTQAGYKRPKYEISVGGRYLFDWSMLGLCAFKDAGWTFSFATRKAEAALPFLQSRCAALGISMGPVVELDALTDGQATTALMLAEHSPPDAAFAVFNIDTFLAPGAIGPEQVPRHLAGWIPCFPGPGDGWSFARVDPSGRVLELREKVRISDHATVGFYWFSSAQAYRDLYASFFLNGAGEERGERYIAPMYNAMIDRGDTVGIVSLDFDAVGMLGTPEQVKAFQASPPKSAVRWMLQA